MRWQQAINLCERQAVPFVLATVLATSGSTPRSASSKMLITTAAAYDTIGGGQLEHLVVERARELLQQHGNVQQITHFPLAAAALQCCGGSVTVLLESFGSSDLQVAVFGAGHVGQRVISLLSELPAIPTLIDTRPEQLNGTPDGVRTICSADPVSLIPDLTDRTCALVMTHDHQLDYRLLAALLGRPELPFVGMIGSTTKWQRFASRLTRDGFTESQQARVRCPVGLSSVPGNEPMAVAIAIVAELLQVRAATQMPTEALTWRRIKSSLLRSDVS